MIREFLVNIASIDLLRRLYYALTARFSDDDCFKAFVTAMNEKSVSLGLSQSEWINPSGLGECDHYSKSCARDLALLGVASWSYDTLRTIWKSKIREMQIKKSYIWHPHMHTIRRIGSTIEDNFIDSYPILGGKTGAGDDFYTLVLITSIEGIGYVAGAIMQATSLENRFKAMHELFDVVSGKRLSVESAKCACAYLVPSANACYTPPRMSIRAECRRTKCANVNIKTINSYGCIG